MKILLLATGGTIACLPGEHGLAPAFRAQELLDFIDFPAEDVTSRDLFSLDSSNIQPEEWRAMARAVRDAVQEGFEAIVITHGTDTLAYTPACFPLCCGEFPCPWCSPARSIPSPIRIPMARATCATP